MDKKEFIKSIDAFKSFSDQTIDKLVEIIEQKTANADGLIFKENDSAEDFYIVSHGEIIISKKVSPRLEKTLSVIGPKSIFGEMALFSDKLPLRTASAKAKTDIEYYRVPCEPFEEMFSADHEGTKDMFKTFLLSSLLRLEQTSRELATVYEISKIIGSEIPLKKFGELIIKQLYYSIPKTDSGMVYLWNEFTEEYELIGMVNVPQASPAISRDSYIEKFLSDMTVPTKIITDQETIKQLLGENIPAKTVIISSLHHWFQEKLMGFVLLLNQKEKVSYGSNIKDLLNSVSEQLIGAVQNIKNREERLAKERFDKAREGENISW